jgi:uncharacterized protein (DUF1330 family)
MMAKGLLGGAVLAGLALQLALGGTALAQPAGQPAYVIVERLRTTGPEDIQKRYGEISKPIVAKFGGRYLSRSQDNALLEGPGPLACCVAVIEFPSLAAAQRWYASPENQAAAKIRRSGATFRIFTIQGLPAGG